MERGRRLGCLRREAGHKELTSSFSFGELLVRVLTQRAKGLKGNRGFCLDVNKHFLTLFG